MPTYLFPNGSGLNTATVSSSPLKTKGDLYGHDNDGDVAVPVGADGQVLVADSTQSAGVGWTPTALRWQTGKTLWISPADLGRGYVSQPTQQLSTTQLFLVDIIVVQPLSILSLAISVSTAETGGTIRLGLLRVSTDGNSTTLLADASTVTTDTTGAKEAALGTPVSIGPGAYQVAAVVSAPANTLRVRAFAPALRLGYGPGGSDWNLSDNAVRQANHAGGAATPLAASYPIITGWNGQSFAPCINLKVTT